MSNEDTSQFLRETRRAEAMALFTAAKSYAARNDQLIGLGAVLIAAIAGVGIKENAKEVLLGVPTAVCLLVIYSAQVDADVRIMGVARRRIEMVLERELGESALIYYSFAAPEQMHRSARRAVVAGLVLAGGAGIGGFVVALQITALAAFVYAVVTATMAWTAFRVVKGMFAAQDAAEKRVAKWPYIRP